MNSPEFTTSDSAWAAEALRPLVRSTHRAIAGIALAGMTKLNSLSPDWDYYPQTAVITTNGYNYDTPHVVPAITTRVVSPKINVNRRLEGYAGLAVQSAATRYTDRRFRVGFLRHMPGLKQWVPIPFSRSDDSLDLTIRSELPDAVRDDSLVVRTSLRGYAATMKDEYQRAATKPAVPKGGFCTGDSVRRQYGEFYVQNLAVASLAGHALRAYNHELDLTHAKAAMNEWQSVLGQEPTEDQIWLHAEDEVLQKHLRPTIE